MTSSKKAGGKKKRKAPAAAPLEDVPTQGDAVPAAAEEVGQGDSPPPVNKPAPKDPTAGAIAGDEAGAEDADSRPQPAVGKGKSKEKVKPKRDFSVEVEQEERLLEWIAEHYEVWRWVTDSTRSARRHAHEVLAGSWVFIAELHHQPIIRALLRSSRN